MHACQQPGPGWKRGLDVADGRGKASRCGCDAFRVGGCVRVLRGLLQARLHIKYILIRFINPRLSWPACRTRLASARASPVRMAPEAPQQPFRDRQ